MAKDLWAGRLPEPPSEPLEPMPDLESIALTVALGQAASDALAALPDGMHGVVLAAVTAWLLLRRRSG